MNRITKFFTPNITRAGRLARLIYGLIMLAAGFMAFDKLRWLAVLFFIFAALAFFEAARGWCVVRACGIKTKF
ncbi:MAG TPA: YgaP-like transmembrane domain [Candidatus Acidoferrum sp.]|nr:YgaP-like transmembrane domain [Candidatus Acidoferrum sp.]